MKMEEGGTGGASDITVKAESSGEDPRKTEGLDFYIPHPLVNKTKKHTISVFNKNSTLKP